LIEIGSINITRAQITLYNLADSAKNNKGPREYEVLHPKIKCTARFFFSLAIENFNDNFPARSLGVDANLTAFPFKPKAP